MEDVVKRLDRGDRTSAPHALAHAAGNLDEPESLALQDHQGLDFRVFKRKTTTEDLERRTVHSHEAGGGIVYRLAENRPQHQPEEAYAQTPQEVGMVHRAVLEAGRDHHLAGVGPQRFVDLGDVSGVVLAVAIEADHEIETQLEGQPVARLHRASQTQMERQPHHSRACRTGSAGRGVLRTVVHDYHRNARRRFPDLLHHPADGSLFVEGGHEDEEPILVLRGGHHSSATSRGLMKYRATSCSNSSGPIRASRRIARRCRSRRNPCFSSTRWARTTI